MSAQPITGPLASQRDAGMNRGTARRNNVAMSLESARRLWVETGDEDALRRTLTALLRALRAAQ